MALHFVGAVLDRAPGPRYFESLPFAEIAPRKPLPRPAVLARWRESAPESARFTLHAPTESWKSPLGAFRDVGKGSEGARWLTQSADALAANAIVVATGAELTPGPRDRERLAAWAEMVVAGGKRTLVWIPGGLWELEEAAAFAQSIGVVCGFDPLEGAAPVGPIAYARVRAIGARSRLGEGLLASIVESIAESTSQTTYLAVEAENGPKKARRIVEMLAAFAAEASAGGRAPSRSSRAADEDEVDEDEDEDEDDEEEEDGDEEDGDEEEGDEDGDEEDGDEEDDAEDE